MAQLKLQIIVGSTREGRNSDQVMKWLEPRVQANGKFEVEVLDLRDWTLPMFQEVTAKLGDLSNPTYSQPIVTKWNAKIKEADAFVVVTPEYNHSVPGVLKNAIDSVFFSGAFRQKPVAFVGYSAGPAAAVRAIEHLNQIMVEAEAVPVRTQTLIPAVMTAFDAEGKTHPMTEFSLPIMLDDLAWMGAALKRARGEGQLPPPNFRLRAAMMAGAAKK